MGNPLSARFQNKWENTKKSLIKSIIVKVGMKYLLCTERTFLQLLKLLLVGLLLAT